MKTIIAGTRTLQDMRVMENALNDVPWTITEVVTGKAPGADKLGEQWAEAWKIPIKPFPANWHDHPKVAGPLRNLAMARYADALLAVWDGKSKGTADMILQAHRHGLKVHVHIYQSGNAQPDIFKG